VPLNRYAITTPVADFLQSFNMEESVQSTVKGSSAYNPAEIEPKWQHAGIAGPALYAAEGHDSGKPKFLLPGDAALSQRPVAHGHVRTTPSADALAASCGCSARTCCIPWAGTPSACPPKTPRSNEQHAPAQWTLRNIAPRPCVNRCGAWASATIGPPEVTTCLPSTTAGTSGFFLKMYNAGLAYRKKSKVNLVSPVPEPCWQRAGGRWQVLAA